MRMLRAGRWITAIGLLLLAGVYVRARLHTRRATAGSRAEDLLRSRSRRDLGGVGDDLRRARERLLPIPQGPSPRPVRGSLRGSRHRVRGDRAHDRPDLGQADLGDLVDLGRPPHADALPLSSICRISAAAGRHRRAGSTRPFCRRARHLRHGAGAVHSFQRLHVPHAAPHAHRAEAEHAVAAGRYARDVVVVGRRVHIAVHGLRDAALRALVPARAARGRGRGRTVVMQATPENGGYMIAAYVIAAVVLVTYAISLYWRTRKL